MRLSFGRGLERVLSLMRSRISVSLSASPLMLNLKLQVLLFKVQVFYEFLLQSIVFSLHFLLLFNLHLKIFAFSLQGFFSLLEFSSLYSLRRALVLCSKLLCWISGCFGESLFCRDCLFNSSMPLSCIVRF